MLYDNNDMKKIRKQQWSIILFCAVFSILMMWLFSYVIIKRIFWPAYISFTFMLFVLIIIWVEFLQPLIQYARFLKKAVKGLGIVHKVTFIKIDNEEVIRFNRRFIQVYFDEVEENHHYERKVYLEKNKRSTPLEEGKSYEYKTLDNFVISLESVE